MKINFSNKRVILQTVIIAAVVLLATSSAMSAYFLYKKANDNKKQAVSLEKPAEEETTSGVNSPEPETQVPTEGTNQEETAIPEDPTIGEITVAWDEWPVKVDWNDLFNYETLKKEVEDYNSPSVNYDDLVNGFDTYKVGVIEDGAYQGDVLYVMANEILEGMGGDKEILRIIHHNDGQNIILTNYSQNSGGIYEKIFTKKENIIIKNLETPDYISIPNSNIKLKKSDQEPFKLLQAYDSPEKLFKYNDSEYVYKDKIFNCIIARANDGTAREYYFDLKFLQPQEGGTEYKGKTPNIINFVFLDGNKNTNEYIFTPSGGCGSKACYYYPDYANGINKLKKIGTANTGDNIYELADAGTKSAGGKSAVLQDLYDSYYPGWDNEKAKEKIPFADFLANHPIIYWQNPFGKFLEFRNAKYLPMVECGKPVIYLYPEKETDVSVSVNPTGGFKITEPAYDNGWKVKAKPDGEIYNYGDGKKYPYLFWEGYALNYQRPNEGFVIARADVKEFLDNKLIQLGLIKKEADEFIEFWLPKMQEKPYYFITFMPQGDFENYAPLSVSPKPDTVIRIFMDYEGLDKYIRVPEQKIITPKREGFVVAEWGGAIHK